VSIECTLHSTLRLGDSTVVFGRVEWVSVVSDAVRDGGRGSRSCGRWARLGGNEWCTVGRVRTIPRIPYDRWAQDPAIGERVRGRGVTPMRFGLSLPCFGDGVSAAVVADWAVAAERAGGTASSCGTTCSPSTAGPPRWSTRGSRSPRGLRDASIRLGTLVTRSPAAARGPRPQTATLDHLSGGRVTLGVGSGDFPSSGSTSARSATPAPAGRCSTSTCTCSTAAGPGSRSATRVASTARRDPEWSAVCFPRAVQRPRIPVWVGGTWPGTRPFVRAARWDGVVPMRTDGPWGVADTAAVAERVRTLRTDPAPVRPRRPRGERRRRRRRAQVHADHAGRGGHLVGGGPVPVAGRACRPGCLAAAARERIDAGP
jgi:hypothetical protein